MWILAVKLPNSDLNFAVYFRVDYFLYFSKEKGLKKNSKSPPSRKIHPKSRSDKFPSDLCGSLLLTIVTVHKLFWDN